MASSIAFLINLASVGIYGYAAYYMLYDPNALKMHDVLPQGHRKYGQFKFVTYHCLVIQLVNAFLHVAAHFVRPLKKIRDFWFTGLAYPIGSIVVYTFWAVYFFVGREYIFPEALGQFYPEWLNQVTHTMIAPVNVLLIILVPYNYTARGSVTTPIYLVLYSVLLYYIKLESGHYSYGFLEFMVEPFRAIYFLSTAAFSGLVFKSGQSLANIFHSKPSQRPAIKKTKQK